MADQAGHSSAPHLWLYLSVAATLITIYFSSIIIYNLYFHPLCSFPGPISHRASPIPYILKLISGQASFHTHHLHEKYGTVVRLTPNHLSFTDVRAWRDIYGRRVPPSTTDKDSDPNTLDEHPKSPMHYGFLPEIAPSILEAHRSEHAMLRKALSNGFSEKALRAQESRIKRYVDFLVFRLTQDSERGAKPLDIVNWYNWIAFDIVGDLVFAEPFGCLEKQEYHPFVKIIVGSIKGGTVLVALNYLGMQWVMKLMWELGVSKMVRNMRETLREKLVGRMESKVEVEDLFEGLMRHREEWGIDIERLQSNASLLVAAGSETTASLLSGVTYLLLSNPEAMAKLKIEIRNAFNSADEITIASASRLPYMLACLNEALRMYPPVTGSTVRQIAPGGATIAGHFLPSGTLAECQQYAMHHSSAHWEDPSSFRPERFLHDNKTGLMKADAAEAFQPFSTGPRNCIGKNLAYAEMRLIIANMIFNFDLTLADESKGWIEKQGAYPLWEKGPLQVFVEPVFA
ncbi:isotrichodermin C-15 hydroxylase [Cercophora newfieldiana]|uniref:Isotrichodermin C-15 hydroxylase n=1 Tax=Cercophora newfieldiana TaxID=92897 RepID=A0AA39Y6A0_9PEZI|nr:isotrichodermin C-15 hydroxylase [Cercophora newfieldiana]